MRIGTVELNTRLALAPMAGVTDRAFRGVCRRLADVYTTTEMVSAKALVYQDKKTSSLLKLNDDERPAAVQLFGSDAACMAQAAVKAVALSGAQIVDLNMGCPTPKIVSSGDGCALMRDLPLAARIIEQVVRTSPVPVTVKCRTGWDRAHVNVVEFARMAESSGASALCVHGRTKVQMYSGRADWSIIAEVKRAVSIPVIANGDVFSAQDALRAFTLTGADMIMIGRAAFGNPWLFVEAAAALDNRPLPAPPTIGQRMAMALSQIEWSAQDKGEHVACLEARRHFVWYLRGWPHTHAYKQEISGVSSLDELRRIARRIVRDFEKRESDL